MSVSDMSVSDICHSICVYIIVYVIYLVSLYLVFVLAYSRTFLPRYVLTH
jgi:hypothetical protein